MIFDDFRKKNQCNQSLDGWNINPENKREIEIPTTIKRLGGPCLWAHGPVQPCHRKSQIVAAFPPLEVVACPSIVVHSPLTRRRPTIILCTRQFYVPSFNWSDLALILLAAATPGEKAIHAECGRLNCHGPKGFGYTVLSTSISIRCHQHSLGNLRSIINK